MVHEATHRLDHVPATRVPHRFRITGAEAARLLAITVPAGLLDLYTEVGVPAETLDVARPPRPGGVRAVGRGRAALRPRGPRTTARGLTGTS